MGSKGGFEMPMPNSTTYPNVQIFPQYGPPLLPPYSPHPPPYQNSFPANVPQMPPYGPPPPYYPPTDPVPPQAFFPPFQTLPEQPPFVAPLHYQQQFYSPNQNQQQQWGNPPSSVGSGSDHAPSCPPAFDNVASPTLPRSRSQPENLSVASSIGFGDENDNHTPGTLYPSLSDNFLNRESTRNENLTQGVTPVPPNLVLLWQGSKSVNVFFVQQEGHVVSPDRDLDLCVYKCPPMNDVSSFPVGSLAGKAFDATVLMKAEETWRLGLAKHRSYIAKGLQCELVFYDDSTSPARFVVVILPKEINSDERQRLNVLLNASSFMIDEPSNIVDKLDSGVETVFDYFTESVNSAVKKGTPELHKNTKWLRKGTGQVVRFGGNLVSKGIHLVSDNVVEKDTPKVLSKQHSELFEALKLYREAVSKNKVTTVSAVD